MSIPAVIFLLVFVETVIPLFTFCSFNRFTVNCFRSIQIQPQKAPAPHFIPDRNLGRFLHWLHFIWSVHRRISKSFPFLQTFLIFAPLCLISTSPFASDVEFATLEMSPIWSEHAILFLLPQKATGAVPFWLTNWGTQLTCHSCSTVHRVAWFIWLPGNSKTFSHTFRFNYECSLVKWYAGSLFSEPHIGERL